MNELIETFVSTEKGKTLYLNFLSAISDFEMQKILSKGVLIGLSGGADSVALLMLLLKYREEHPFKLKAVHVNHCIRGSEADRDENFSKNLCEKFAVEFESHRVDVPKISKMKHIGLEEAARNARYEIFNSILDDSESLAAIAVAHNATDNLETVIFNMMRGAGIAGISGIKPIRDNIVRPLIYSPKDLIVSALMDAGIAFVEDSTNKSADYSRNYIRHEIIPKLRAVSDSPEAMATRMTNNLREDGEFILNLATKFVDEKGTDGIYCKDDILLLEKPVFSRVIMIMCNRLMLPSPEKIHIDSIYKLCREGNFSYSLPGGKQFISCADRIYIGDPPSEIPEFFFKITEGVNSFENFSSIVILSKEKDISCYTNIYKKSIQVKFKFDIINNGIYIRSKRDGDSYRYGKMNRKLKKLFNDKKIPNHEKRNVPIFCDNDGIFWVPGFGVRDSMMGTEEWYLTIAEPNINETDKRRFFGFDN